jgi:hypothetical protein
LIQSGLLFMFIWAAGRLGGQMNMKKTPMKARVGCVEAQADGELWPAVRWRALPTYCRGTPLFDVGLLDEKGLDMSSLKPKK